MSAEVDVHAVYERAVCTSLVVCACGVGRMITVSQDKVRISGAELARAVR